MSLTRLVIHFLVAATLCRADSDIDGPLAANSTALSPRKSPASDNAETARSSWQETFREIGSLVAPSLAARSALLNRWKTAMDGNRRFEEFFSWERRLQQWKENASRLAESSGEFETRSEDGRRDAIELGFTVTPRSVEPEEEVLPHTDLSDKSKNVWIVTTAALPWMTGTAVNALLRAAYLSRGRTAAGGKVTIHLPWLERELDQENLYKKVFSSKEEQETSIRNWLREVAGLGAEVDKLNMEWYPARENKQQNSVYCMGDIVGMIPKEDANICILEEPEHLNWFRAPEESWTIKFPHVVGIVHTNYFVYAQEQPGALIRVSQIVDLATR